MKHWPYMAALVLLGGAWGLLASFSQGEDIQQKRAFQEFPVTLADQWHGKELGMEQEILDVLKLTDYMMRVYWPLSAPKIRTVDTALTSAPRVAADEGATPGRPLWLYVGYYESQRTGSTYHSPKNCLPGAGWQFVESDHRGIALHDGRTIVVNRVLIQKGLEQQVILYWYHDRGRVIASEYWAKAYMIWDAMTKNRTDGSLVRVSIPVSKSADDAYQHGVEFVQDLWPVLLEFMPDQKVDSV